MSDEALRDALEELRENWSLEEIVSEAIREAEWCCEVGCGSGACEACPCCSAGYCVSGRDGLPNDDPEAVGWWLEIASQHNPAIASLRPLLQPQPTRDQIAEALHALDQSRALVPRDWSKASAMTQHTYNRYADVVLALINGGQANG